MNELVLSLIIWISSATGYAIPANLAEVRLISQAELAEIGKEYNYEIVSLYDNKKNIVYLHSGFDPEDLRHQADLLHELVHFLQAKNRTRPPLCEYSDEQEAYNLENRWLAEHGLPPATPELFIGLASICVTDNTDDAIATLKAERR